MNGVKSLRIGISLPYLFTVRDFLFTPVWQQLEACSNAEFFFVCDPSAQQVIEGRGCGHIRAAQGYPVRHLGPWSRAMQRLDDAYLLHTLMYRFSALNGLSHYRIRRERSPRRRRRDRLFYSYKKGEWAGFPIPRSQVLYRFLYGVRHGALNRARSEDIDFFRRMNLDLFVFGRVHSRATASQARALKACGVPMLGMVSSWDHPTTQGPSPRGISQYLVASRRMKEEMNELHGVPNEQIVVVGKVQMDSYFDQSMVQERLVFLAEHGVPAGNRVVLFGPNTTGLNEHEISIARRMASDFSAGRYPGATLLIRAHPQDRHWKKNFKVLESPPHVVVHQASAFGGGHASLRTEDADDPRILANLVRHADVIIQSRGSLALDAVAADRPVINLGFDGDVSVPPNDSFLREYEWEHFKPILRSGGTWLVGSYPALDRAIRMYLDNPGRHAEGRDIIRRDHIEPFDGRASQRLVDAIVTSARRARDGDLPSGDWKYRGLGDRTWHTRQGLRVEDYLDTGAGSEDEEAGDPREDVFPVAGGGSGRSRQGNHW